MDKEYKATAKGSKDFEKSQEGLKTKLNTLEKKYDIQKAKLEVYNNKVKESKERIQKKKEELEKLKGAEGDNTKAIEKAEKQLETYKTQLNNATKEISLTETEMKSLKAEISETGDKLKNVPIEELNSKLKNLEEEYKSVSAVTKEYGSALDQLKAKQTYLQEKYDTSKTKLEQQKKIMQESAEKVREKKKELENLKNAEGDNTKAIEKAEKELTLYQSKLDSANKEINKTENELKLLNKELENNKTAIHQVPLNEYKEKMEQISSRAEKVSSNMKNFGQGMENVGGNIMKATAPVVAFTGYALKATMSFEAAMSDVQAISGATGGDLEKLSNKAKEMGKNTSKSAKDAADGMSYMALAGWNTQQMLEGIEPVLRLSEAGNLDLGRASDLTTDSLSALGLQVSDLTRYLDICAQAQRKSNTTADMMMEAYIGCGGTMKNLKVPLEESATYIGILANRGLKGSEAGVALNSVLINLTSGAGQAGKAMSKLGLKAFDSNGKFKGVNVVLTELNEKLSHCTEEQRNTYLAMIGGKTQIDTLNALLSGTNEEYGTLHKSITNSNGALNEMAHTMQNNAYGNITKLKSQLEGLGIQLGENLLPHVNDFIGELSKLISWFGSLGEGTQKLILKFGLFSFAGGATIKTLGGVVQGAGSLVGVFGNLAKKSAENTDKMIKLGKVASGASKGVGLLTTGMGLLNPVTLGVAGALAVLTAGMVVYETHNELMNQNILYTTDQMSWLERVVAKFTGVTVKSKEELIQMGLVYKDFSQNISKEFQDKVVENTAKINEFDMKLSEINLDNVLTKEETEELNKRVDEMADSAINTIKTKQDEANKAMKEFFLRDDTLSENEQKVLEALERISNLNIEKVSKLKEEIYEIERKALDEKGYLSEEEINLVKEKRDKIAQIELESIGKTEEEVLYAQNEFQNRVRSISLEDASKLMEEKAKIRDDEYVKIKSSYDTSIELLQKHLGEADETERAAMQEQIESLTAERDQKIKVNDELYDSYLKTLGEKNPAILAEINRFNGEILSEEDHKSQKMLSKLTKQYDGLKNITESGNYIMVNSTTGAWESVSVTVDKKTGEITGVYDSFHNNVGGYTAAISNEVKEMAKQHKVSAVDVNRALNDMSGTTINASGQIVDANGNIIASLQDVKTNADGTREGVLNLNGTPINIKADAGGAIKNLTDVQNKVNNLDGRTAHVSIFTKIKDVLGFAKGTNNAPAGTHLVGEEGFEIATKGNKMTLVGLSGPEFRRFSGGEKVIPHAKTMNILKDVISSGSYFSRNSLESQNLINNINNNYIQNSNINNNFNAESKLEELTDKLVSGMILAFEKLTLENNVKVGNRELVDVVSNQLAVRCRRR
ncbi:phage tail tape measure protein [Clostridium perfringens]|uniref:Phage tail tape measure protein n=1 Tax=Clostridium perfringens TaxID=1502 RepID=A0AAP4EF88_CLOPF|nr:phage tail tape measure protein [Clostridium perfringens]MDH2337070.1 phage tail tape measure protein [Clostridium perfringens]